jgi:hypothetical protein
MNAVSRLFKAWAKRFFLKAVPLLLAVLFALAGCAAASETSGTTSRPAAETARMLQAAAQGGNLHYRNLVLAFEDRIIFNSVNGQLSLAASDGSLCAALLKTTGVYPAYDGSRLFYVEDSQSGALAKIGLDGTNQVRIGQAPLKYLISDGNWLYAIESDSGSAVRLKKDGSDRQVLSDGQPVALTLADGQLYISGAASPNGLIAVDLATDQKTTLLSEPVASLNVCGEWLYFSLPSDNYQLYAWSLRQKKLTPISHLALNKPFIVSDQYLYFIHVNEQNRLYRLPLAGARSLDNVQPELMIDDLVDSFVVCGDWIYYQRPASTRIYGCSIETGEVRRIS